MILEIIFCEHDAAIVSGNVIAQCIAVGNREDSPLVLSTSLVSEPREIQTLSRWTKHSSKTSLR